jgi:1-acyl-sn-glycerol-3-phosphate acyltransferase
LIVRSLPKASSTGFQPQLIPLLGFLIKRWGNGIPVKRGRFDVKALRSCFEVLDHGKILCIFIEGTRAREGQFLKPKWGAGMVALKSKVPIIPCLIEGSGNFLPRGSFFPRFSKVSVKFGKQFNLDLVDRKDSYQVASDLMMKRIKELSSADSIS